MSDSCHSRHFSWLMKSCFPNPQHHHPQPLHRSISHHHHHHTTISSLPDDLLLECLSRVSSSSLPSVSLVCRRWSRLLSSSALYDLRRRNASIYHTVFVFSVTDSGLFAATLRFGDATLGELPLFPPATAARAFEGRCRTRGYPRLAGGFTLSEGGRWYVTMPGLVR
ncbi:F-box/kelch-repeat protein [Vitis vinifera]|uniref:F-box/kelch-repeat protein n=1 Tax=Vitis vinifera TaxID=29760 RepID=A0A438I1W3_VITVI|nr:F-box/kelch-repeat protein [Vitis vinifera]